MKRTISARSIGEDIRSGLSETELMAKHGLTLKGLQRLFIELVHAKIVTHQDLYERFVSYRKRVDLIRDREARRVGLSVSLPLLDVGSRSSGILRDISETGLRVAGLEYQVGELATFQVPRDLLMEGEPLLVTARCRWVSEKSRKRRYSVAGFEFVALSPEDEEDLKEFIDVLTLTDSGQWHSVI